MHKEVRLRENAVDVETAIEIVRKGSYGVLSTIGQDGYPYGVPLNYSYVDKCICFHCGQQGHKLENIDFSKKVSFCVVTKSDVLASKFDTDYESAIAFGTIAEVTDDAEKRDVLMSLVHKYSAPYAEAGENYLKKYWDVTRVFKIAIEHLTGKVSA